MLLARHVEERDISINRTKFIKQEISPIVEMTVQPYFINLIASFIDVLIIHLMHVLFVLERR